MPEISRHPDDQPDILTSQQFSELEMEKAELMMKCKKCNTSGYLEGGVLCDCLRTITMKYALMCSNIPKEYQNVSFDKFHAQKDPGLVQIKKYVEKLDNAKKKGIGLHIHSKKPGAGKTMLASCVLLEAIKRGYYVWFTTLEQLADDIKLGFKDERKRKIINWAMFKTDFILIDEMAKFQSTDWKDSKINDFIQRRVNENLPFITTENMGIDQLQQKYPDHLISRFAGTLYEVTFTHTIEYRMDVKRKNILKELMEN